MLPNCLLYEHVTGYQSYIDPPCYPTGYWMNMSRDFSHMLIPMLLNWLLDVHVPGYQSYVDPQCYSTGYWMYMFRDISHMLIPHVTQLVIGCTCHVISVIC
jgi:hypothetical protein